MGRSRPEPAQVADARRYLRQRRVLYVALFLLFPSVAGAVDGGDSPPVVILVLLLEPVSGPRITVDPRAGSHPGGRSDQLPHLVLAGALPVGTRLPTIRRLAGDLGLAADTVARVYRELEADGVLWTVRRQGTVVDGLARVAAELGADPDTAVASVFAAWPPDR